MPTKKVEIEDFILRLLNQEPEVSVRSVARARGISQLDETQRRAIRRAFSSLENRKLIISKGSGPARAYVLAEQGSGTRKSAENIDPGESPVEESISFKGMELSPESKLLLRYVSQDMAERLPVGYDQEFLRSYEPNRTFYLSLDQRERLRAIGRVEAVERPAGTYARNILDRLLIDLSWNSSRLEGNTYSLLETKRLIELGETATGKDASEAQMILNHKAAIEYIVEFVRFMNGEHRKIEASFFKPLQEKSVRTRNIISIVGGTLGGYLIGGLTGARNGVLIGAGVGAAAGTTSALLLNGKNVSLRSGDKIEIELKSDVTLPIREI